MLKLYLNSTLGYKIGQLSNMLVTKTAISTNNQSDGFIPSRDLTASAEAEDISELNYSVVL
jgi:hypothetical protein